MSLKFEHLAKFTLYFITNFVSDDLIYIYMRVWVYVCVWFCILVCGCVYVYVCMSKYICTYIFKKSLGLSVLYFIYLTVLKCIRIQGYMYAYVFVFYILSLFLHSYMNTYVWMNMCMHICSRMYVCVCLCACMIIGFCNYCWANVKQLENNLSWNQNPQQIMGE